MNELERTAAKEAAELLGDFGLDLLDNMSPQGAFHAMASGAVLFGCSQVGPAQTAAWLRILADEVEKRVARN